MATMNVSLPDAMKDWVEAQVRSGRYANSSDLVRDLIRRDQKRGDALAALQAAVDEGLADGPAAPWDLEAFLIEMHARHGAR
jgi:antitoxin ParD1/3/4